VTAPRSPFSICKLHLGPIHDKATREELVAFLGNEYVEVASETVDQWGGGSTRTTHEQARPKLAPEQLAQLGDGEAIAIHGLDLPAIVKLPYWWEWLGCASRARRSRSPGEVRRDDDRQEHRRRLGERLRRLPGEPHGRAGAGRLLPRSRRRARGGAGTAG